MTTNYIPTSAYIQDEMASYQAALARGDSRKAASLLEAINQARAELETEEAAWDEMVRRETTSCPQCIREGECTGCSARGGRFLMP